MNPEHVNVVLNGRDAIAEWRLDNPSQRLDLSSAELSGIDLSEANLSKANLHEALLLDADLSRADLSGAILIGANEFGANLFRADLSYADLSGATLSTANLAEASLWGCKLIRASLSGAELTGAKLYGTARDQWVIEDVKCKYVFWDFEGKERSPRDRDLEPGEFERLYAQMPTIEYVFENGMTPLDPLVMDRVVQAVNEQNPEFNLQIESITARGIYPIIKFTVQQEEQKAAALEAVTREREIAISRLEGKYEGLLDAYDRAIKGQAISIGSGSNVTFGDDSPINIQEYIGHLHEIQAAIENAPHETVPETLKREAQSKIRGAINDVIAGNAKKAAEAVTQLGIQLGPRLASSTAFQFFKDIPL